MLVYPTRRIVYSVTRHLILCFFCTTCRPKVTGALKFFNKVQDKQNALEDKITKLEDEIHQQNSLSKRVKDLEVKLTTNTDQIPQSKQNTYASKVSESNAPPLLPTEAPKQIPVTSDRKFNIVVFGVEEPPSEMSRINRQKHDLGKILKTISSIDSSFTAASFKDFHRVGKFRQNASKP